MTKTKTHPDERAECYDRVRSVMRDGIAAFYTAHPKLFGDTRSQDAVDHSLVGLRKILDVLEDYEITRKVERK